MLITLTLAQWTALKPLVTQGQRTEHNLGIPVEIINGDQKIEIEAKEIKINLDD